MPNVYKTIYPDNKSFNEEEDEYQYIVEDSSDEDDEDYIESD